MSASDSASPRHPQTEPLWSLWVAGVTWSCQLVFHGESYGWEAQILHNGELFAAHGAFVTKAAAVQWGQEQRRGAEKGFLRDY